MQSLSLTKNSQAKSPSVPTRPSKAAFSGKSFLGQLNPNGTSGAAISIANPQFGSRSSSAGKLHLKGFLG